MGHLIIYLWVSKKWADWQQLIIKSILQYPHTHTQEHHTQATYLRSGSAMAGAHYAVGGQLTKIQATGSTHFYWLPSKLPHIYFMCQNYQCSMLILTFTLMLEKLFHTFTGTMQPLTFWQLSSLCFPELLSLLSATMTLGILPSPSGKQIIKSCSHVFQKPILLLGSEGILDFEILSIIFIVFL